MKYFEENPDYNKASYNTMYGIYTEGCGLENVFMSWGHDDYMYLVSKLQSQHLFHVRTSICGYYSVSQVAKENQTTLPSAGLFIIRYHSFYGMVCSNNESRLIIQHGFLFLFFFFWFAALHKSEAYKHLMNDEDRENMKWLKVFNKYDLYSKSKVRVNVEEVKPYYLSLINKVLYNIKRIM